MQLEDIQDNTALVADIEHTAKRFKYMQDNSMLSNLFKALEVDDWGTKHDDYVTALRHWSSDMGVEARSHLVYHLKRIGLRLISKR